jgi:hypothetical protein
MTDLEREALEAARGLPVSPKALGQLGARFGDEVARWAVGQWQLRGLAARKFSRAAEMLFDREGLEMASSAGIAAYHARQFPVGALVLDLTAGLGADTTALAARGPVIAYERDAARARLLSHNLQVCWEGDALSSPSLGGGGAQPSQILIADGLDAPPSDYVFADPSRRSGRRFSRDLDAYEPHPSEIVTRHPDAKRIAIKLSPMLPDDAFSTIASGRHYRLEFLSWQGECPEALLMVGSEIDATWRGAVMVGKDIAWESAELWDTVDVADAFLYEADPAAIRAHALGAFGLAGLADSNGYLTGPDLIESPWLRGYRVLSDDAGDARRTLATLRSLEAATPVVKVRGVEADPEKLRKSWRLDGHREVIVIVYPVGRKVRHAVVGFKTAT